MIESSSQAPTAEVLAYSTKVAPSYHVTCTDCGAIIARHEAHPFVSHRQAGEVVELLRRFICQDRESCQARGPITQRLAQLQATVDGLEQSLAGVYAHMEDLEDGRILNRLEVRIEDLEQERDELKAALQRIREIVSLPSHTTAGNPDASERVELISEIVTAELIR